MPLITSPRAKFGPVSPMAMWARYMMLNAASLLILCSIEIALQPSWAKYLSVYAFLLIIPLWIIEYPLAQCVPVFRIVFRWYWIKGLLYFILMIPLLITFTSGILVALLMFMGSTFYFVAACRRERPPYLPKKKDSSK